jgi:processive 1,2-diacylglycerol beta-glucosyltransferase
MSGRRTPVIQLIDAETGKPLGAITEAQLQFLVDQLEEESADDTDYYVNRDLLDVFAEEGADPQLLATLRRALGDRDEMDVRWTRS